METFFQLGEDGVLKKIHQSIEFISDDAARLFGETMGVQAFLYTPVIDILNQGSFNEAPMRFVKKGDATVAMVKINYLNFHTNWAMTGDVVYPDFSGSDNGVSINPNNPEFNKLLLKIPDDVRLFFCGFIDDYTQPLKVIAPVLAGVFRNGDEKSYATLPVPNQYPTGGLCTGLTSKECEGRTAREALINTYTAWSTAKWNKDLFDLDTSVPEKASALFKWNKDTGEFLSKPEDFWANRRVLSPDPDCPEGLVMEIILEASKRCLI